MARIYSIVVTLLTLLIQAIMAQDIRMPPSINIGPKKSVIYKNGATIQMTCDAAGVPAVEYRWLKDLLVFDLNGMKIRDVNGGNFTIEDVGALEQGYYQCQAFNQHGTAISVVSKLTMAVLADPPLGDVVEKSASVGNSLTLACDNTKSVPAPTYTWVLAEDTVSDKQYPIRLDERVQVDPEGNLHFANVLPNDHQGGKVYKCNVKNSHLDHTKGGSYKRINVPGPFIPSSSRPVITYSPNNPLALVGHNATLTCLFSGYPTPRVQWEREGSPLPGGRYERQNTGTTLFIRDVREEDQGFYRCTGGNSEDTVSIAEFLKVEAIPTFKNGVTDRPHDVNATVDDDVSIQCKSYGIPAPNVQWLVNGEPLKEHGRMSLSDDGTVLSITSVCKECVSGRSDIMNIQCNASNVHGYVFVSSYLNVLMPTRIKTEFDDEYYATANETVEFPCNAESDDSTPVRIDWMLDDEPILYQVGRLEKLTDNSLLITLGDDANLSGKYTCLADNGYSRDSTSTTLYVASPTYQPQTDPLTSIWWIFLLIAVLVLLLLLLLCCCICIYANRGDVYKVDHIETKQGLDPVQECKDTSFKGYERPPEERIYGSRAPSLSSTLLLAGSLHDYGADSEYGGNYSEYGEDGSFIGTGYVNKGRNHYV